MMAKIDYLDYHDLIQICQALIPNVAIRDEGLLKSAIERPKTTVFGEDSYKTFEEKAAALMHSLARNHALVDGNKRISWAATRAFCILNGYDIKMSIDDAEELVVGVAAGKYDVPEITKLINIVKI